MPRILYKDTSTVAEEAAGKQPGARRRPATKKAEQQSRPGGEIMPLATSGKGPRRQREVPSKADLTGQFVAQPIDAASERQDPARSAAAAAAGDPAAADFRVSQKPSGRKDEASRRQLLGRLATAFSPPITFTAAEVLKALPELGGYQSAYAFLQTARRRGQIEKAERGSFRLTAADQEAPQAQRRAVATEPGPAPADAPSPPPSPVAAPVSAPKPAAPAAEPRNEQAEVATLLQLSRRYRSDKYFRLDDILVPLRECRSAIYGTAEIGAGDPPMCVVVAAYEPNPRVLHPQDIDVLFLDAHGQAQLRSAASWQFVPCRRNQG
jgi:hypothetical protein